LNGLYAQLHYFLNLSQLLVSCLPLLAKLIQVFLIIVAVTTEVRHTWINQFAGLQGAGLSSGSSAAVHKVH